MTPTERLLDVLEVGGLKPRRSGSGWAAHCPAHEDHVPSLSINEGEDARVLVYCHAGCKTSAVIEALGLTLADLMPPPPPRVERSQSDVQYSETRYEVRDESGALVAVHARQDGPHGKAFFWERDGSSGLKGLPVASLPLYGTERISSWPESASVVFVEGEKACDALLQRGFHALATVTGASGCPGRKALGVLRRRRVVLWPDNDRPGHEHMDKIASRLHELATTVKVFNWKGAPERGDAADYPGSTAELSELLESAPEWRAGMAPRLTGRSARRVDIAFSSITPTPLSWLWPARIPKGMVTLLAGDGGRGKSTLLLDVAARVTTGQAMPDGSGGGEPASVLWFSAEDAAASVLVPRLALAGADLSRVRTMRLGSGDDERDPQITPEDLAEVQAHTREHGVTLVVFDPLVAFVDERADLHRNHDARRTLSRLHALAERSHVAMVGVHHFNRGVHKDAVHRLTGSAGLANAARSVLVVAPDPDDSTGERMILALAKVNLAPRCTPSLAYRLKVPGGAEHPVIEWEGPCAATANDLVAMPADPEGRGALNLARAFLKRILAGGPVPAKEAEAHARAECIAPRTLERARHLERVEAFRAKIPGPWSLRLPVAPGDLGGVGDANDDNRLQGGVAPKVANSSDQRASDADVGGLEEGQSEQRVPGESKPKAAKAANSDAAAGPDAPCPECGGRVLQWTVGLICTGCHRRLFLDRVAPGSLFSDQLRSRLSDSWRDAGNNEEVADPSGHARPQPPATGEPS